MKDKIEWKGSSLDYDKLNELTHSRLIAIEGSKRLNNYLTSEMRSKMMTKKITKEEVIRAQEGEHYHYMVAAKLNMCITTYRKAAKKFGLYDNLEDISYTCNRCGKTDLDLGNYTQYHGENCILGHVTKELILEAHSLYRDRGSVMNHLKIHKLGNYHYVCKRFGVQPIKADKEAIADCTRAKMNKKISVWEYNEESPNNKGLFLGEFDSVTIMCNALGLTRTYVYDCIKGTYPTAKKVYVFEK